jgi:hypothetical protein
MEWAFDLQNIREGFRTLKNAEKISKLFVYSHPLGLRVRAGAKTPRKDPRCRRKQCSTPMVNTTQKQKARNNRS